MGLAMPKQHASNSDLDRIVVNEDLRKRIIDLTEMDIPLPEAGIYDEPVRYYKANLEWATIIEGHVHWLAELAAWKNAQNGQYAGIQAILEFLQGVDMPSELQLAITEGIYKAVNDIAKQIVSGSRVSFSVDENGNIVPPSSVDADLPADDPATPLDESQATKDGICITTQLGLNDLFSDLNAFYGVDAAPDTPLEDAIFFIDSKYSVLIGDMTVAITEYYARRAASEDVLISLSSLQLNEFLFCHGREKQDIVRFISEISLLSIAAKKNAIAIVNAIGDDQFARWHDEGVTVFSTMYLNYACVPIPTEGWTQSFEELHDTNYLQKDNHRYFVVVDGVLTDPDGDIQDAFYYVAAGGSPVFNASGFVLTSTGFLTMPNANRVPYSPSHVYSFTYDKSPAGIVHSQTHKHASMAVTSTGTLHVVIQDLGEIYD